jgi:hypothetical protein
MLASGQEQQVVAVDLGQDRVPLPIALALDGILGLLLERAEPRAEVVDLTLRVRDLAPYCTSVATANRRLLPLVM